MRRIIGTLVHLPAFLVLLGSLALAPYGLAATPFTLEYADTVNDVGRNVSLALDPQGNPHMSYYEATNGWLKYASRSAAGVWTVEAADNGGSNFVGKYSSLVLDAQQNPHISYYDVTAQDLKYAKKVGGVWVRETVDTAGDRGTFSSIALDAQGNPHISYYYVNSGYLMYASRSSGGTWTTEVADNGGSDFVGQYSSLALDALGRPHIAYYNTTSPSLRYARKDAAGVWGVEVAYAPVGPDAGTFAHLKLGAEGEPRIAFAEFDGVNTALKFAARGESGWTIESVDNLLSIFGNVGGASLALDVNDNPCIGYMLNGRLRYAVKSYGVWTHELVNGTTLASTSVALALDANGNPKIASFSLEGSDLLFNDSSVRLVGPPAGTTWPVGALRNVDWAGVGTISILLSGDGGATYEPLVQNVQTSPVQVRVPHLPTRFARLKVQRSYPFSEAASESSFTIQTSVSLLSLLAAPAPGRSSGATVTWSTDPGPPDLAGYRLERASSGADWRTIVPLTRSTEYEDAEAGPGSRYRLFAVNGFGEELMLGETAFRPAAPLAAWPVPYRGGNLTVSFATASALGGGLASAEVSLFDASGRLVRTLAHGSYTAGYQLAVWDGGDAAGRRVAAGIYFLRAESAGQVKALKLAVLR